MSNNVLLMRPDDDLDLYLRVSEQQIEGFRAGFGAGPKVGRAWCGGTRSQTAIFANSSRLLLVET